MQTGILFFIEGVVYMLKKGSISVSLTSTTADYSKNRFFHGFEYTFHNLPHTVISCEDAANAKGIPLRNELKSLILKTDNGFCILNLTGDRFANLKKC